MKSRLRILHVVPSYLPARRYGGPIYSVHGLCKSLALMGHDVHVVTTSVDGSVDSDVPHDRPVTLDGVQVHYFRAPWLRRFYWSPALANYLQQMIPTVDILHIHSIYLWPTAVAASLARKTGKPYVLAPRGMLVKELVERKNRWLKTAWIDLIEKHNIEHATALHFTSVTEQEAAEKFGFKLPQSFITGNGIAIPVLNPDCAIRRERPYVLYLGRINWKKGLDKLIAAWKVVIADIDLVIAGNDEENYLPQLKILAHNSGVADRVHFTGAVDDAQKWQWYQGAKLFVLPSMSENFGNTVLEAMAAGCPVIVTREVGLASAVKSSATGIVLERHELSDIAAAVNNLIADPATCTRMGANGKQYVQEQCSWDVIAAQMEQHYHDIIWQLKGKHAG